MGKLAKLITTQDNVKQLDDLSTDAQTLFGLLVLIVDIKYRIKCGDTFDEQRSRGYSKNEQFNEVLADQVSPVDNGLLGY